MSAQSLIDRESERAVTGWIRLADKVVGRKPEEGRCDRCGRVGELSREGDRLLCARCVLEGAGGSGS
jgi:ribosomal protein S27AE